MILACPGSQKFKHPKPEMLICPYCSEEVELWTDESEAKCQKCGKVVARQLGQGCLDWCKYARDCVGLEVYNRYVNQKQEKGVE
jgi:hypothetical protein